MDEDEWTQDYDEWEIGSFTPYTGEAPTLQQNPADNKGNVKQGPFPEIEINSSSDDDAPPPPPSTQLARENLKLRSMVSDLKQKSQNAEKINMTLKKQLSNLRSAFRNQVNSSVLTLFK
ncbi:hypothetical protein TVAG_363720 [Trichomonas vaginalis G3]|uniref:Uncharacterized protein n=1 Tax=Trichomonas vaginalis (strain ATCC PRA-98 / G3) TaxID=412133 RepID=A2EDU1_TRIV3|nr:hypothetical protein TVAGG3_0948640 [Trichomonas vaginalis G3]EAY09157.1 hypothetical protein TVAG_363720 [Trichomonas vaginalis G3]KAI5487054.1 hypothetical protein TVAGG3_0948640 [Trichomonas vaginalis G3]|eukprot:XP_001321380.1 hypothetical protein [Trichomonas vaginalis G3]